MARALITGVAGFTGKYLVDELAAQGVEAVGIGIEPRPSGISLADYRQLDMLDCPALDDAVKSLAPDMVFHLAGMSHVVRGSAEAIYRVNVVGTRNLLTALESMERPPRRVILASTANLYGNQGGVLTEDTPPSPMNDYAVSKLAMEYMAALHRERLPITIVRPFNYTGRGQSPDFLIPKLVKHFRERLPVIELGNLDVSRDFSDVRDVARRYAGLAMSEGTGWGPYNFCSGQGLTLKEILSMLESMTGHHPDIQVNPAFVRANEVRHLVGSSGRVDAAIGAIPLHGFQETLRWMLDA